jgi:predicted MPP superfamily phosphohydrolase
MPGQAEERPRLSRRTFLKLGCGALMGGAASCLLGPIYVTQVEPDWIEVTRVDIPMSGLPEALEGFTIAQLGDFHLGQQVSAEDVRRGVKIANGLGADLILLTGDFVTSWAGYSAACAQELAVLETEYGVYAVLGNHDIWTDPEEVAANVAGVGIALLRNERKALEVGGFFAAGASSFGDFRAMWQDTKDALASLLEGIPPDEPRLLLVHNPDFTEMLPEGRIDLALCGHTHGGQVRLPFVGEPVTPSCFGRKYARGLVQGPSTLVYVNRGIGLISPPVRFNCRPEVTLLRLSSG